MVEQPELRAHHILQRQDGEARGVPVGCIRRCWVRGGRASGPIASAEHVRADDEVFGCVEGEAGADTASVKSDLVERVDSILAKAKEVDTELDRVAL